VIHLTHRTNKLKLPILLLSLATIFPVILHQLYINTQNYYDNLQIQKSYLQNIAKITSAQYSQITEGARQLLISISTSPQINQGNIICSRYLSELMDKYKRYDNIYVSNSSGNVLCSAKDLTSPVNLSDRYSFQQVFKTRDFAIGEFTVSRITDQPILNFAYPIINQNKTLQYVIYTALDLKWLYQLASQLKLDPQLTLYILDKNGKILAENSSDNVNLGKLFTNAAPHLHTATSGTFTAQSIDGHKTMYAFETITQNSGSPFILVGVPDTHIKNAAFENFKQKSYFSAIIIITSLLTGWFIGNYIIKKLLEEYQGIDNLKRDFVSLVSHQIRTPITGIRYFTNILLSNSPGKLTTQQHEFLQDIQDSIIRISSLVTNLLEISKLESGKIQLQVQPLNLHNLLKEIIKELQPNIESSHSKIVISRQSLKTMSIVADCKLIKQVIINFLTNALKYSPSKSRILVELTRTSNMLKFSVYSPNSFIYPEDLPHIFTKFYRGSNAKKIDSEGSGLGLYFCKLVVESHHGSIATKSIPKHGTYFYFTLPNHMI
jgi:C4-dicarboxylate-specific signal transduction histidine kinase